MTVFADWNDVLPEARRHLDCLENFIGNLDGKTICIPADGDTFIDDGVVDADDAVKAVNALARYIKDNMEK